MSRKGGRKLHYNSDDAEPQEIKYVATIVEAGGQRGSM